MQAQSILQKGYETSAHIFDHFAHEQAVGGMGVKARPLVGAAMHPAERIGDADPLFERLNQYRELRVHEYFKLTLSEFLSLPRATLNKLLRVCEGLVNAESSAANDINKLLKDGLTSK